MASIMEQFKAWVNIQATDDPDRIIDHHSWVSCAIGEFATHLGYNGFPAHQVSDAFKRHYGIDAWKLLGNAGSVYSGFGSGWKMVVDMTTYKDLADWLNSLNPLEPF